MQSFTFSETPIRDRYLLMVASAVPRPIAFVSSLGADGRGNLAPFSYFTLGGANPPSCVVCPLNNRVGEEKDTLQNIREAGEYVINIVTSTMAEKMNQSSYPYERGDDEFDRVGFTRLASDMVKPPRVAESPIQFECRLFKLVQHGEGALASNYIIGEILKAHVAEDVMTEGAVDNTKLDAIGRPVRW